MAEMTDDPWRRHVSVVGSSYLQPIVDLVTLMLKRVPTEKADAAGASVAENGYAASICILAIACIESYGMRVRYDQNLLDPTDKLAVPELLLAVYPDLPHAEHLSEAFSLRDSICHNHLWHVEVADSSSYPRTVTNVAKEAFGGNKRHRRIQDGSRPEKSRRLRLNLIPTCVRRSDARKTLA
jgi:hypothetical protein